MRGRVFSREFKLDVCRQIAGGEKRVAQVCREHQLGETVLLRWRKEYEVRGEAAFTPKGPEAAASSLVLQLHLRRDGCQAGFVVAAPGGGLVAPPPMRPGQDGRRQRIGSHRRSEAVQQPADFGHRQRQERTTQVHGPPFPSTT